QQLMQLGRGDGSAAHEHDAAAGEVQKEWQQHRKKARKALCLPGRVGFWSLCSFELECVASTCDQSAGSEARGSPTTAATCAHRRPEHGDLVLPEPQALSQAFQWFAATLRMYGISPHFSPRRNRALRRR